MHRLNGLIFYYNLDMVSHLKICESEQLYWEFGCINIDLHFTVFTKRGKVIGYEACAECQGPFESSRANTCIGGVGFDSLQHNLGVLVWL